MIRTAALEAWAPRVLSILRILIGLMFMEHGTAKLLHFPPSDAFAPGQPLPPLIFAGGVIELVAGALIAVGLFTRPAAFIAAGEMAVAYWMFHFKPDNPFPANNGGDAAILYCFVFLYLVFRGAGPWSVDGWFDRRRPLSVS
ncbi:MAG TPA: DoxX family protein [Caulobacteraceae bacterium]|jgi:putative oxidoreductase